MTTTYRPGDLAILRAQLKRAHELLEGTDQIAALENAIVVAYAQSNARAVALDALAAAHQGKPYGGGPDWVQFRFRGRAAKDAFLVAAASYGPSDNSKPGVNAVSFSV